MKSAERGAGGMELGVQGRSAGGRCEENRKFLEN
jgi:hypothetical protein